MQGLGSIAGSGLAAIAFIAGANLLLKQSGPPHDRSTASAKIVVVSQGSATVAASIVPAVATAGRVQDLVDIDEDRSTRRAVLTADKLPPLDLSDMRLWNWAGIWHASEWENGQSPIPWRYNHIKQVGGGSTKFTLDANGAPQLQAVNGTYANANGLWESDVTLPIFRDGLVVAPLWLYDPVTRDEIDFEFAGRRGLDVSLHAYVNGVHKQSTARLFANRDLSGRRTRFGIRVDQAAGTVEMLVDGERVYLWTRSNLGFFVSKPLKPWIEMWAADPTNSGYVQWAGKWAGIDGTDAVKMIINGYRYAAMR